MYNPYMKLFRKKKQAQRGFTLFGIRFEIPMINELFLSRSFVTVFVMDSKTRGALTFVCFYIFQECL